MGLGMDVGVIENVCYVSKYFDILSNESFYKVCCDITPKAKKYCKWIKSSKPKYGKKIVDIICNYYKIGKSEAYEYCKTFYKDVDGLTELTKICSDLGYEDEQIEKFLKGSDE
jgi:hypothetical protein